MTKQRGFTLIELIIVIIILGILAVTAAPRFFNFADDARVSAIQGAQGAIQGASQIVFSRAAIDGKLSGTASTAPDNTAGATGNTFIDLQNGYPRATQFGIIRAAQMNAAAAATTAPTTEWVFETEGTTIYISLASIVGSSDDVQDTDCYVSYTETTNADVPPAISAVTSGCGG